MFGLRRFQSEWGGIRRVEDGFHESSESLSSVSGGVGSVVGRGGELISTSSPAGPTSLGCLVPWGTRAELGGVGVGWCRGERRFSVAMVVLIWSLLLRGALLRWVR